MDGWLASITTWFLSLFTAVFAALWSFVYDALVRMFEGLLGVASTVWNSVPVPCLFVTGATIGDMISTLSGAGGGMIAAFLSWIVGKMGLGAAFSLISCAYLFRLARKAATLGQW
jgi:hypothetical protein